MGAGSEVAPLIPEGTGLEVARVVLDRLADAALHADVTVEADAVALTGSTAARHRAPAPVAPLGPARTGLPVAVDLLLARSRTRDAQLEVLVEADALTGAHAAVARRRALAVLRPHRPHCARLSRAKAMKSRGDAEKR